MHESTDTRGRSEAGFTLVEALIAIVVLVFGLIAITNLMIVAASSNTVANQSTAAAAIASEKLEELKRLRFDAAGLQAGGDVTADNTGHFEDTTVAGVGTIHTRWKIVNVDSTTKFITVASEGTGVLSRSRSRAEFTTFRVQNP